jgi:hypothetical protein
MVNLSYNSFTKGQEDRGKKGKGSNVSQSMFKCKQTSNFFLMQKWKTKINYRARISVKEPEYHSKNG